jgi:hypothetical protein
MAPVLFTRPPPRGRSFLRHGGFHRGGVPCRAQYYRRQHSLAGATLRTRPGRLPEPTLPAPSSTRCALIASRMLTAHAAVVTILAMNVGCVDRATVSERIEEVVALDNVAEKIREVALQTDEGQQVIRVSGTDWNGAGEFLIADASEGNVKMFDAAGQLLRIYGRKGDGPGEYRHPRFPRFAGDELVYIGDSQNSRVTVIDTTGAVIRILNFDWLSPIMGFAVLSNGNLVLAGLSLRGEEDVLFVTDAAGNVLTRHLPIGSVQPIGSTQPDQWRSIRQFFLTVSSDRAYVVSTVSDSLWVVDFASGATQRSKIPLVGYRRPVSPERQLRDARDLDAWASSFHTAAPAVVSDSIVLIPFVQGILNYGDPQIIGVVGAGRAITITDAPPLIAGRNGEIVTIENAPDLPPIFGFYQLLRADAR